VTLYVDTSALLSVVLGEGTALDDLHQADRLVSSELLVVEARRTIDRLHRQNILTTQQVAEVLEALQDWLEAVDLVLLRSPILNRAGDPLPAALGTLAALHLATALIWRERSQQALTLATHDLALGTVARTYALPVIGC
jgi:predicted nucleic acid-binding protein